MISLLDKRLNNRIKSSRNVRNDERHERDVI